MMERPNVEDAFEAVIAKMPEYLQELKNCDIITKDSEGRFSPSFPADKGIYVFYEDEKPMYVGRSDRLNQRLRQHGLPSSNHNSASFAFNIAREEQLQKVSNEMICTKTDDSIERFLKLRKSSRTKLEKDPEFQGLFIEAKQRVRNMGIRVVEIQDPIEQTIFEIYAHMRLNTPFNSFENH